MHRFLRKTVLMTAVLMTSAALAETVLPKFDAEVRRVNPDAGKITLRHGEIPNLDMPPMTMVFEVADPTLLQGVSPGDRLRMTADRIDGAFTVLSIEAGG
ncbi:hypothetical protein TVNIR_1108 [Thioalkalivibrio nitratireducens DSM 14787]|uniref:Uncharacterized protein n=1 Tax=Thioalkalivibrio nitratireducens (strain DSM 14787 / UNIQEM 213 / ALEN2) TaxID=1255043 RepID=L0DUV2_THIND|nr:copper-binding protein [Thioalkalivibrio nitratireducens]AGA32787.1 hypothetical protein TVNIR_1108 [Thioalkalivibrio nitratireducens DSM 14787]